MATKTSKKPASTKAVRPARKAAPRAPKHNAQDKADEHKVANVAEPDAVVAEDSATGARHLLRAGLKALGDVRGDVLSRQSRVFEVLLGIGQAPAWKPSPKPAAAQAAPDPFGKFEDVFDERVARSLERMGMPSPQALRDLTEQVRELNELLRSAKAKAPRRR